MCMQLISEDEFILALVKKKKTEQFSFPNILWLSKVEVNYLQLEAMVSVHHQMVTKPQKSKTHVSFD